jgi:RNA polymerase sigma factor (sigma-70 family)
MREEGFTAFCEREYPAIVGALSLWCGDRSLAEEVASEAFARAYRDWGRVRHLDAPGAWVRRVAINLATSSFRRRRAERRARRRLAGRAVPQHDEPDGAQGVAVREALQQLREDHRIVLVLRYFLDLSIDEVAQMMGRSRTGVTTLTQRASAALREVLGDGDEIVDEVRHER